MKLPADLHESELAELARIAFASGDPVASEIALRALRRREDAAAFYVDPAQLHLFTTEKSHAYRLA